MKATNIYCMYAMCQSLLQVLKILPLRIFLDYCERQPKKQAVTMEFYEDRCKKRYYRASGKKEYLHQAWETRKNFTKMTIKLSPKGGQNLIRQIMQGGTFQIEDRLCVQRPNPRKRMESPKQLQVVQYGQSKEFLVPRREQYIEQ